MTEEQVIKNTIGLPLTVRSLETEFKLLGIRAGMTLLVHSSLSSLGWVCGGAQAVMLALEETLGEGGTLVMPAHSGSLSEPSDWHNPPVPESWWPVIRREMPAFTPDLTPTRAIGVIAETFRAQKGVSRSYHPSVSFAARGKYAGLITCDHSLGYSLGERSPLARIYELGGYVLLLGAGYSNCTSLHLSEYRADYKSKSFLKNGAPIIENGKRVWKEYDDIDSSEDDFEAIGAAFETSRPASVRKSKIGNAEARLVNQRDMVDFAVEWMQKNRQ